VSEALFAGCAAVFGLAVLWAVAAFTRALDDEQGDD